ncbi:MAG: hypothetical protein JW768_11635 [Chitinispirillaceae bacterium]|nr:hypothetical protein [Chitinispirillaceae bacterium]
MKSISGIDGEQTTVKHHAENKAGDSRVEDEVCPECNGSLYISCFTIDGIKITGCPHCKGSGKR